MKAQQKETFNYGFKRTIDADFEQTIERTKEALKKEGFGVLSEIRIDEKLKEKLGVDFRRYLILGACNPSLAHKTLQEDINIGLLLPCNVIVYEADNSDSSVVAAIDAKAMMSVVGQDGIEATANEVNEKLQRAIELI
jgi:uncharacterized protein (DUF302 family)